MKTDENEVWTQNQPEEEEEVQWDGIIKPTDVYPADYQEKYIVDSDLPSKLAPVYEILGFNANKRFNYFFLNDEEILLTVGNTFQIFNIVTKQRRIYNSTEVGGIGAITTHPSKNYFAIGECGQYPNIYVYQYTAEKQIKLDRILRKGTDLAYSALSFNQTGELLASVGGDPDYNLVIWNWKTQATILKAKAFSQEVFRVSFSDNFEGKLITSGMGHIKFWTMAQTFTGWKLQGELGKFGQIDLSDVSSFVEFPDGKVLCGTEHGTFLLWEGIQIKANLKQSENEICHSGWVEHMSWEWSEDQNQMKIMTAGHDGYVKWWKYLDIENVILDDYSNGYIQPVKTIQLVNPKNNKPLKIMNLVKQSDFWLIQDGNGYLVKVKSDEDKYSCDIIFDFHNGAVKKAFFWPNFPILFSFGIDKKLSMSEFDSNLKSFPNKVIFEEPTINSSIVPTCSDIFKYDSLEEPLIMAVGYNNGVYKILTWNGNMKRVEVIFEGRPHENPIVKIQFSPDGSYLCTITKKEIFFFLVEKFDKIIPWCCIKQSENDIMDIDWHPDSKKLLVGLSNGTLEEIEVPIHYDNTKTFIITDYTKQTFKLKLAETQIEKIDEKKKQRLKEAGKYKEEPEPGSVLSCKYIELYQEGYYHFLVTSQKPFNEFLHICTFNMADTNTDKRPIGYCKLPSGEFYIRHISNSFVFITTNKGSLQIRYRKLLDKYIELFPNLPGCLITDVSTSVDETWVSVSFQDGTVIIYNIDIEGFNMNYELWTAGTVTPEKQQQLNDHVIKPPVFENKKDINSIITLIKQGDYGPVDSEISDEAMLSLENSKQLAQEKEKERIADEKRQKLFAKVNKLREDFQKWVSLNNRLPEEIRLTIDELTIDNKYLDIVDKEKEANIEDIEHKYKWLKAQVYVTINKIETFFLSSVETSKVVVYSLRKKEYVSTLRCPALPSDFNEVLVKWDSQIEDFKKKIDFDSLAPRYQPLIESNKINEEQERQKFDNWLEESEVRMEEHIKFSNEPGYKQVDMKPEIERNEEWITSITTFWGTKADLKMKIAQKEEKKDAKVNIGNFRVRCPERYNWRMQYTKYYDEKNMLTQTRHKQKMYLFLKLLYDERQNFNNKIFNWKEKKSISCPS